MKAADKVSYWRKMISDWEQSDLSQPDFCKKHDISYVQFGYWRTKFNKRQRVEPNKFIPIKVNTEIVTSGKSILTLNIAPHVSLTVNHEAQIDLAAKLLKALQ